MLYFTNETKCIGKCQRSVLRKSISDSNRSEKIIDNYGKYFQGHFDIFMLCPRLLEQTYSILSLFVEL